VKLKNCRVLLTGASGGIGRHLAMSLAKKGARLALLGRQTNALNELSYTLKASADTESFAITADLTTHEGRCTALKQATHALGGIDLLINNAGIVDFHSFESQDPVIIDRIFQTNLIAPVQLTRAILPHMKKQGYGRIVNIGSTFGSIGFAYFATYSSSKFALRGFSESLRRELAGSGIGISYIAPRAVKTPANSDAVYQMAKATSMNMDEPEDIARFIVQCIIKNKTTAYYGWPEKFFVHLNALLPKLIDNALHKQNQIIARFAPKT